MRRPASGAGRGIGLKPMPQMERREAQRPTLLGAGASQRRGGGTHNGSSQGPYGASQAPGASRRSIPSALPRDGKKGKGGARAPRHGRRSVGCWLFEN